MLQDKNTVSKCSCILFNSLGKLDHERVKNTSATVKTTTSVATSEPHSSVYSSSQLHLQLNETGFTLVKSNPEVTE